MKPAPFEYARPRTVAEALGLLAEGADARAIAGGQSLGPMLNLRLVTPRRVVDVSRLEALRRHAVEDGHLVVGAAVCHAEIEDGDVPDVANGLLARVAAGIAYRAVRNRGTIGGSLAHADPAADWPPVLIALGATATVVGARGARETSVADLITGVLETSLAADELIETVRIPRAAPGMRFGHHKACRKPGDFAESLAVVVRDAVAGTARAVLSGRALAPAALPETARAIAAVSAWSRDAEQAVRRAVAADCEASGASAALDAYALALHQASIARAAREACAP